MLRIPQADPRAGYLAHRQEIDTAVGRVLESGRYILGREGEEFERAFAAYLGVEHAVGVASGTDALELALSACGIGPGDAVATVSHTAVATVAAIRRCGAVPVFVDVEPDTYGMDAERLADFLGGIAAKDLRMGPARVRAVVPVHLYGCPADLPAILAVARRHGLKVVEDCAQAHGAAIGGRKVGTWGDAAAFSFYPTKNLGALGDGGAVATDDAGVAAVVRARRQYGWRERFISESEGGNSRLDEVQAAVLRARLPCLDGENARRAKIAEAYAEALKGAALVLPSCPPGRRHVFHQYVIRTRRREELRQTLENGGIGTAVHYPLPVHRQPAYRTMPMAGALDITDRIAPEILSLPMYPQLTEAAALEVARCIRRFLAE